MPVLNDTQTSSDYFAAKPSIAPCLRSAAVSLIMLLTFSYVHAQPTFSEVAAIFEEHCTLCHSGANPPLGLRLDSYENVMQGSQRGGVVLPGDAEGSELVHRIRGTSLPRMPLTGPPYLSDEEIMLIVQWIAAGASQEASRFEAQGEGDAPQVEEVPPPAEGVQVPAPGEPVTFTHVSPIFLQRCVLCHGNNSIMGTVPEGLRLETYDEVIRGGERVVVVPGSPLASELYRRIQGHALPRMPLNGPPYLSDDEIRLIHDWIAQGAANAEGQEAVVPLGGEVRLHGVLTAAWELDGLALRVIPETRLDDHPATGSYVEVRGIIEPGGMVRATRIRPR